MKQNMLKKKRNLGPGEIVKLCYDQAFKIMYGNAYHLEILTMLLSKILEVDYNDLVGNITLLPLNTLYTTIGEKKSERDVVVSVKYDQDYRIILEVNVKKDFYETVMDRNIYYTFDISKKVLEGENYDNMDVTFLINFNTFYINKERKKVFDEYLLRNEEGDILTKKYKILNINIEECYQLWYDNNYQGKFGLYEEDLLLLSAAMFVSTEEDFFKILELVRMKPEIKELMEGVLANMNKDSDLVNGYYNWKEEQDKINNGIINEVKRKSLKEGLKQGIQQGIEQGIEQGIQQGIEQGIEQGINITKKEMIINMYNDNLPMNVISKYTNLSVQEVEEIIENFKKDSVETGN